MKLSEYFNNKKGMGVLSTADTKGKVDAAIYTLPHFINEEEIAFIAADKLTHANLQNNPSAVYLFKEQDSYEGRRLYLTKMREEKDTPMIDEIRRKKYSEREGKYEKESKFLIFFKIDKVLPLIGEGK